MIILLNRTHNFASIRKFSLPFIKNFNFPNIGKEILKTIRPYNNTYENKQLICISPAGFKGFYLSGIITYIKENYDISNFIFSGASAGAWNSLLFTYKGNLTELIYTVIEDKQIIKRNESIRDFKYYLKDKILTNYDIDDFELERVYVGVTTLETSFKSKTKNKSSKTVCKEWKHNEYIHEPNMFLKTSIYHNFNTLEDILDCCIASSHIPFFMGRILHKYDEKLVFDGGFSAYPYFPLITPTLNITPNMWNPTIKKRTNYLSFEDYTTLLSKEKYNFIDLYWKGYYDTEKNREYLDKILPKK